MEVGTSCVSTETVDDDKNDHRGSSMISKEMVPCKLMFFFFNGAFGALTPFTSLFYVSSGLTVSSMGLSNGIGNASAMLAGPLWGALIDSSKHRKLIAAILFILITALEMSKPWIFLAVADIRTNNTCHNTTNRSISDDIITLQKGMRFKSVNQYSPDVSNDAYKIPRVSDSDDSSGANISGTMSKSDFNELHKNNSKCKVHTRVANPSSVFHVVLISGIVTSITFSGFVTYLEGVVVNVVYSRNTEMSYGQQKVFAPVGWAVGTFVAGRC